MEVWLENMHKDLLTVPSPLPGMHFGFFSLNSTLIPVGVQSTKFIAFFIILVDSMIDFLSQFPLKTAVEARHLPEESRPVRREFLDETT